MEKKACSKCELVKPFNEFYKNKRPRLGVDSYCIECVKALNKAWRKRNSAYILNYNKGWSERNRARCTELSVRWRLKNPQKIKAHAEVNRAIGRGELFRGPCEVCGAEKAEGHHEDYSKPLEVVWLCSLHHKEKHRQIRRE